MGAKHVNYVLIPEKEEPYQVLAEAIAFEAHDEIRDARVALAWRLRTKEDPDGKIVLGKCIKVTDLQKEFAEYDFIITLNKEFWDQFSDKQKLALVDHELCHGSPKLNDETGEQIHDERGRKVWRIRKHDLEEFVGVVERHGMWKKDIERFAQALRLKRAAPLFESKDAPERES